jgi:hypothetical protein
MAVRSIPVDPANANRPKIYVSLTVYDPGLPGARVLDFGEESIKSVGGSTFRRGLVQNGGTLVIDTIAAWAKGIALAGIGEVSLINTNGALDALKGYTFDGFTIAVDIGTVALTGTLTRTNIFTGIMENPDVGKRVVSIPVRTQLYQLDKAVLSATFLGTGGLEGDDNLKGTLKPRIRGLVNNLPLILVDSANVIYFQSDGPSTCDTVYDAGIPLTYDATGGGIAGQYTTVAAFNAAAPAPGHYVAYWDPTTNSPTYMKFGSTPNGQLTQGVALALHVIGGVAIFNKALPAIVQALITDAGISTAGSQIQDLYYPVAVPGTFRSTFSDGAGFYLSDNKTYSQVIAGLLSSFSAWMWFNTVEQRIVLGQLPDFDTSGNVYAVLKDSDIFDMRKLGNPKNPGEGIPPWSISVDYMRNETVQASGLATGAALNWRGFVAKQYRTLNKQDASVLTRYPLAQQLLISGSAFNLDGSFPIPATTAVTNFLTGIWNAFQLGYDYYSIEARLTPALLQQYTINGGFKWVPAIMPGFLDARLGIRTARYGFTNTGKGTEVTPMAISLDLARRRITYIVRTTYQVG